MRLAKKAEREGVVSGLGGLGGFGTKGGESGDARV
jgi:hypothetical protein